MLPASVPPPPPLSAEKMTRHVLPAGVPPPVMELYQQLAQRVTANEQSYLKLLQRMEKLQQRMEKLLHVLAHTKKITPEVEKELSGACSQAGGGACSSKSSINALRKPKLPRRKADRHPDAAAALATATEHMQQTEFTQVFR